MRLGQYIYVGVYQALNLGDDLFLKVLFERYPSEKFLVYDIANYRELFCEYKNALFLHPLLWRMISITARKCHLKRYSIKNILASRCKIAIEIGGSIFVEPRMPEISNDLISKKPYFVLGANFGPYSSNQFKEKCRDYLKLKTDVCFRDYASYNLFSELSNVRVAPDILWTLKVPCVYGKGLFVSVMCLERSHPELVQFQDTYNDILIGTIREWIQRQERVVLGSFCMKEGDEIGIQHIWDKLTLEERRLVEIHYYRGDIESTLEALNSCEVILATRFHSVVLGLLMGKRVIPICYSNKTENLLDDIGLGDKKNLISDLQYGKLKECSLSKKEIKRLQKEAEAQFQKLDSYLAY